MRHKSRPVSGLTIFIWSMVAFQAIALSALLVFSILNVPYGSGPQDSAGAAVIGVLASLVYPVVGVIIFTRRPNHPIGWLFCVSQAGWAAANVSQAFGHFALKARPDLMPLAGKLIWFDTWPGYLSTALLMVLILTFPDGRLPSPRWKPAAWLVGAWAVLCVLASAFAAGPADPTQSVPYLNPLGIGGAVGRIIASVSNVAQPLVVPLGVMVGAALVRRFRSARGQTREQLKWLAVAIVLVVICWAGVLALLIRYPTTPGTPAWAMDLEGVAIESQVLIPIAAGIAILRYHLFEIDRIINLALVYFSLTFALALVYFVCIVGLQTLFSVVTGEGQSSAATVLSTLAIAGLFTPLRRRIQSAIDRRFYRQKYNTQLILDRFSGVLQSEVDLQLMSDQLVDVVNETFQPEQAVLWLSKK